MHRRISATRLFLLVFLFAVAAPLAAQQLGSAATLRGRVLDPQKHGVAGRIEVRYPRTGVTRETRADASGHFSLPALAPGDVDVLITAQGFADRRIEGVHLEVGQA